jgi:hypothetical protein
MTAPPPTTTTGSNPMAGSTPTPPPLLPGVAEGLVLWGAPASGKTGLLGALYATHASGEDTRWEAHPKDCEDEYTQQRLFEAYEQLLQRRNDKTTVRAEFRPLRLTLRQYEQGRQRATLRLALVDPAGEFSTSPELGTTPEGRALFRQIATSNGLLWLFDAIPDGQPSSLDRLLVLQHLVALLEAAGTDQLALPVGLCLSKIDCLDPARRAEVQADPRGALIAHLGQTTFTWFEAVCPSLRCFAISSAGVEEGKARPIGLSDAFSWFAQHARTREVRASRGRLRERLLGLLSSTLARGVTPTAMLAVAASALWLGRDAVLPRVSKFFQPAPAAALGSERGDSVAPAEARTSTSSAGLLEHDDPALDDRMRGERRADARTLARAREARRQGDWNRVVDLLRDDVLPAANPSSIEWDTLLVRGALRAGLRDDERPDRELLELAHERASRVIANGPAGSRALVPMRYARATACLQGSLGCPMAQVREDLTWTMVFGRGADRTAAKRVLVGGTLAEGGAR